MPFSEGFFEETKDKNYLYVCRMQENHTNGVTTPAHRHDFIEMLYGVDCDCVVYTDNHIYNFKNNDFIIVKSQEIHKIVTNFSEKSKYIYIKFKPEAIYACQKNTPDYKYILPFVLMEIDNKCYFSASELNETCIGEAIWSIYNEIQSAEYGYEVSVTSNLHKICLYLLRYWHLEDFETQLGETNETRINKTFKYINENYHHDISAYDIAEMCHISYSYFSRWFKKIAGQPFIQYLNAVRLKHAEQLIMETDLTIGEISQRVGFPTTSYFIKQFKRHNGYSPGTFKKVSNKIETSQYIDMD